MKLVLTLLILLFIFINYKNIIEKFNINNKLKKNKLKIVVTFYNPGSEYLKRCLKSIENQTYQNYELCLINDKSNKEIQKLDKDCNYYQQKNGWKYYTNPINKGPCYSRDKAIDLLKPNDDDIIVLVDGDDKLHDNRVFEKINNFYQDDTLITFGNFIKVDNMGNQSRKSINCKRINLKNIIKNRNFRHLNNDSFPFSHLKTFKYKLYRKINHEDLKRNGEYIRSATDVAIMIPMLEMAGTRIKCIEDVLYDYTKDHNESFHVNKKWSGSQTENALFIRSLNMYKTIF